MANDFFYDKLTNDNLDNFFIRDSLRKAISKNLNYFKGNLLDAGCGKMPYMAYILDNSNVDTYTGLDIEASLIYDDAVKPDFTWDGIKMPFEDESFDTILSTEVLEHCYDFDTYIKECLRVLKPNGTFFFTVPYLWPLHETPHDHYRYTPFTLTKMFQGFSNVDINIFALGGWNASLATMLGLWVNRYLSKKKAKFLKPFFKIIIKNLIKKDKVPLHFKDNIMITGLYGVVKKKR